MSIDVKELVYNWESHQTSLPNQPIKIHDESLRDGLQSPMVKKFPTPQQSIKIVRLENEIGIDCANIGFPSSSESQYQVVTEIAKQKVQERWTIKLMCAARCDPGDIRPIIDISNSTGTKIEAGIFIPSSKMRMLIQRWDLAEMTDMVSQNVKLVKQEGLPVMFVTEDTTRAHPETVKQLYQAAIDAGANKLCVCDTVGFAVPDAAYNLVKFVKDEVVRDQTIDGEAIEIEWHSHKDRGYDIANTWMATKAGATRVEGTLLGIGERAGNTPTELLLLNESLAGDTQLKLSLLERLGHLYARSIGYEIQPNHPLFGSEAFSSQAGVHASAIMKAYDMGREDLAALVYCGFDPKIVGGKIKATIGPYGGISNALLVLRELGQPTELKLAEMLRELAKKEGRILTKPEILNLAKNFKD